MIGSMKIKKRSEVTCEDAHVKSSYQQLASAKSHC